ncbi:MAG: hypothetical protein M3088_02820, partial [Actinomycetota bacterium]|nr:hypothetical protein [Actinomycetota bacterium]
MATVDAGQQQHLKALEHANRVRLARAELKRRVNAGAVSVREVILSCPWEAHRMEIGDLLTSQKRWGRERCRRLLMPIGIPENKPIGTLTERQRLALSEGLGVKAPAHRPVEAAQPQH